MPEIRCYDYVNHPYERVRDALRDNSLTVFQSATKAAASRAQSIAAELHVDIGGVGVKTDIRISVKSVEETILDVMWTPATRLLLEWEAATKPGLFPLMKAELSIYPLTATETQLDFLGLYEPPFGPLGKAINAIVGPALRRSQFIASLATWHDTFDKPPLSQRYRCTRRRASWPLRVSWKLFPGDLKTETFHHPSL